MAITDSKSGIRNPAFMILLSCFVIVSLICVSIGVNDAEAVKRTPSVLLMPTNGVIVGASSTKVYTVTITNNDDTSEAASTFNLSIYSQTLIPPGNPSFNTGSTSVGTACNAVALSPGQRCNTTLTVTKSATITEGDKLSVVVQATEASHTTGRGSCITKVSAFKGDGNLLKRAEEETCHVCHKTDRNRTPSDPDWNDAIKMHSSKSLGSNKWFASGGWGVAGGKYGEFGCTTCHIEHSTKNIYLIRETITTPDGSNFVGSGTSSVAVDFRVKGSGVGNMGDDTSAHGNSSKICEVCHTYDSGQTTGVNKHAYSSPAGTHYNAQDCSTCHSHIGGFRASCNSCHGNPPTTDTVGGTTGVATPATGATLTPNRQGAHNTHVTTRSMICNACHTGNTMPTVSYTIQIGFVTNSTNYPGWGSTAVTTGSFDGHTPLNATYTFVSSNAGTTVTTSASYANTCSNLYCHGGGTTGTTALTAGTKTNPSWVGGSGEAACGTCHGGSGYAISTATPPTTGKHTTHAGSTASGNLGLACNKCHNSTSNMAHVNGTVSWSLDTADSRIGASATYNGAASGITPGLAPSATYASCANLYCHSNGKVGTSVGSYVTPAPAWGGVDIGCNGCHGTTTTAGTPDYANEGAGTVGANSHQKHTASGTSTCVYCHSTTTTTGTTITGTVHIDNTRNVQSGGGKTFSWSPQTCTTISCHSGGNAQWGATLSCISCHGGNAASGSAITLGSHTKHINNAGAVGTTYRCAECHNTTVSSGSDEVITTPSNHGNEIKDVSLLRSGSWGSNKCSSNNCHGTSSPTWGGDTSTTSCEKCHGSAASATSGTFKITAQTTVSALSVIHVSHLASTHNYSTDITCAQCHTIPGAVNSAGHIDTALPAEVPMGGALAGSGGLTPSYDSGTKTCSTFYCHGYSLASNTGTPPSPIDVHPDWTVTTLNGLPSTVGNGNNTPGSGDCAKCHAFPPMNGASGTHTGKAATDCTTCHTHVNSSATGFTDVTKHINGSVEGGTCDSCHSYDVVAGSWGTSPKSVEGYGAHAKHIMHLKTRFSVTLTPTTDVFGTAAAAKVCGTCHTNASAAHSTGGGGTRTINFGDSRYREGSTGADGFNYVFGASNPVYSGVVGNSSSVNPKSCSNISCHFRETPVWQAY